MELSAYLKNHSLSEEAFARVVGVRQSAVNRYCRKLRVPRREIMQRIIEATDGQVTANDFHTAVAAE